MAIAAPTAIPSRWELAAETIAVKIRWFGLLVGYVLVNVEPGDHARAVLNAILALGGVYALLDTYYSLRGRVFLGRYPLSIYSGVVQFFLCWIVPFGLASYYPSVRLLGRTVTPEYAPLVPVVAVAFFALALLLWNAGTRHYSSTGS